VFARVLPGLFSAEEGTFWVSHLLRLHASIGRGRAISARAVWWRLLLLTHGYGARFLSRYIHAVYDASSSWFVPVISCCLSVSLIEGLCHLVRDVAVTSQRLVDD